MKWDIKELSSLCLQIKKRIQQQQWTLGVQIGTPGVESIEPTSSISLKSSHSNSIDEVQDTLLQLASSVKVRKNKHIAKKQWSNKWKPQQIQQLLMLCNAYGTDFGMIALHMKKTRDQVKRKYVMLSSKPQKRLDTMFVKQEENKMVESISLIVEMNDLY